MEQMILAGYMLKMTFEDAVMLTSRRMRQSAGGLPRNTLLVAVCDNHNKHDNDDDINDAKNDGASAAVPRHAILLQVTGAAPLPSQAEVEQTYYDMAAHGHRILDNITDAELSYTALQCDILGMLDQTGRFIGADAQIDASPQNYSIYAPQPKVGGSGAEKAADAPADAPADAFMSITLDDILNGGIGGDRFTIGVMRQSESSFIEAAAPAVDVSVDDFVGSRTAIFGKTRTGKSNTVKIIAESLITERPDVGQLIFDVNGEYANANTQDDVSLYHKYKDRCAVYGFHNFSDGRLPLKIDFYMHPDKSKMIINEMLQNMKTAHYVTAFTSVDIDPYESYFDVHLDMSAKKRLGRRIIIYWCILYKAGFRVGDAQYVADMLKMANECRISRRELDRVYDYENDRINSQGRRRGGGGQQTFDSGIWSDGGTAAAALAPDADIDEITRPDRLITLDDMLYEWQLVSKYVVSDDTPALLSSSSMAGRRTGGDGNDAAEGGNNGSVNGGGRRQLFTDDDQAALKFLAPKNASGPTMLARFKDYHAPGGGDVANQIKAALTEGKTVILDLSSAHPEILSYFSQKYTTEVFAMQEAAFTSNQDANFIQVYVEEAHEIFPNNTNAETGERMSIYMRVAKEGAKFRIGMIYSTQSVTMINRELLAQTENFFISHMSSTYETDALVRNNQLFRNHARDILYTRTVGLLRLLTRSHRFVIPVQIRRFGGRHT